MQARKDDVIRIITRMAAFLAVLVSISLPVGFGLIAFQNLSNSIEFKAKVKASALEDLIASTPDLWMFAENRIQGLISREPVSLEDERVQIFDTHGMLVAQSGDEPPAPVLNRLRPLFDGSRVVGQIEIRASMLGDLYKTLGAAAFGLLLGTLVFVVMRVLPLRALKRVTQALLDEKERAETTLRGISDAVSTTDEQGLLLQVNPAALAMFEATSAAQVIGKSMLDFVAPEHRTVYTDMLDHVAAGGTRQLQFEVLGLSGGRHWLEANAVPFRGYEHAAHLTVARDVTDRKLAEEKINMLAFYDHLTGLANRTLLLDRLRQTMTASSRSASYSALLFIDLDKFKTLNDTLGHNMGDELLAQLAQRLTSSVRAGDTVARLGGDEFVVMLVGLDASVAVAATQIETVGGNIQAALDKEYQLKDVSYQCTASIGATLFNGLQVDADTLLKQADLAMYRSKDAGGNSLHFFDSKMELAVLHHAAIELDLREAIRLGQFLLHYQAQIEDERLTGVEALVRWQSPKRGLVFPAAFIPLAEETGLILPLGQWVLDTACTQLVLWAVEPNMSHLTIAVNVSARQFLHGAYVEQVLATLERTGANPQRLKLELTESVLVSDLESVIQKMLALRSRGIGFSLDDFGTGYSSLSYLKRLPLDQLKVDQAFVREIGSSPEDVAIVKTIVTLGQSLGLAVIAEGVETAAQRNLLADLGCHMYQGYYFSRPLPIDAFEAFALGR